MTSCFEFQRSFSVLLEVHHLYLNHYCLVALNSENLIVLYIDQLLICRSFAGELNLQMEINISFSMIRECLASPDWDQARKFDSILSLLVVFLYLA
jgi:hypothetical protein